MNPWPGQIRVRVKGTKDVRTLSGLARVPFSDSLGDFDHGVFSAKEQFNFASDFPSFSGLRRDKAALFGVNWK